MNTAPALTPRQQLATYLTIALAAAALVGGLLLRTQIQGATLPFTDRQTGITARFPLGWLLERGKAGDGFVMRVSDPEALPFKTTISITTLPSGPDANVNDVTQLLAVRRAGLLASYKTLDTVPITLPDGTTATQMSYAYASAETNPSLKGVPLIVNGIDVIVISRGQTIVITFVSDAQQFERTRRYFDDFLRRLALK